MKEKARKKRSEAPHIHGGMSGTEKKKTNPSFLSARESARLSEEEKNIVQRLAIREDITA